MRKKWRIGCHLFSFPCMTGALCLSSCDPFSSHACHGVSSLETRLRILFSESCASHTRRETYAETGSKVLACLGSLSVSASLFLFLLSLLSFSLVSRRRDVECEGERRDQRVFSCKSASDCGAATVLTSD